MSHVYVVEATVYLDYDREMSWNVAAFLDRELADARVAELKEEWIRLFTMTTKDNFGVSSIDFVRAVDPRKERDKLRISFGTGRPTIVVESKLTTLDPHLGLRDHFTEPPDYGVGAVELILPHKDALVPGRKETEHGQ